MSWRNGFNVRLDTREAAIPGSANIVSAAGETKGVFITPQAIVTFPVATFVVALFWKVSEVLWPSTRGLLLLPMVISFIVGGFICWVGITDPQANMSSRDKVVAVFVGLVNSVYIFSSTVGIAGAVTSQMSQ